MAKSFMPFRFFELPPEADTGNGSVKRPYFLSDHIRPPCTEVRRLDRVGSGGTCPVQEHGEVAL